MPIYGTKNIAVREGILDLHGKSYSSLCNVFLRNLYFRQDLDLDTKYNLMDNSIKDSFVESFMKYVNVTL